MKKLKWNIGIIVIRFGYLVRKYRSVKHPSSPPKFSIRWKVGKKVLGFGYWLRGEIPQKTWR